MFWSRQTKRDIFMQGMNIVYWLRQPCHINCTLKDLKGVVSGFSYPKYEQSHFLSVWYIGHDRIWHFSYPCRKFSELSDMLFLSSTPSSQNLKFIKKCLCLSSLKIKFYWTQTFFEPALERSWHEFFESYVMVQVHTIYPNPAPGCYLSLVIQN